MENESHIYTDPVSEANCPQCGEVLEVEGLSAFTNVECPKCGHMFHVPAHFGPFLLLELLGAGGMGGVYLARDEGLKREVAIKVMLQSLGDDIDFVETFQREAQAAAKLNNPHIAQIYSFGQQYGQPYIVMELVSNGSLEDMMVDQGGVDPAMAIHVGTQIAEGLREAAEAGLVHGDVKPENILFDEEGNAKLVDFGLVALSSGKANEVWGTPFYIAPEKVRRAKSDYRSDIYSLGATLYHAIANQPPFDGVDATAVVKARFEGPPKSLSEVTGKEIPPDVEKLIARMLEVDPGKRYPTYGSLMGDMKRYLSKAGPVSVKKSSRRIKIKGKDAVKFDRAKSTQGVTGRIDVKGEPLEDVVEEESSQSKGCKKMAVVGGLIFLGLIILGGVIATVVVMKGKKAIEQNLARMESTQEKAVTIGAKAIVIAKKNAKKIHDFAPDAMKIVEEAEALVVSVLGEEVRARMVPPEPEYSLPEVELPVVQPPVAEADGATNDVAAAGATNVVNSVDGTNAVATATNVVEEVVAEPEAAPELVIANVGELPRDDDHPVVSIVRSMYEDAYAVKLGGVVADQIVAELEAAAVQLDALNADPTTHAEMGKIASDMSSKVNGMAVCPEIKEAPRKLSNLKKTFKNVKADLNSLVAQKMLDQKQKEKQARLDAAAEKKLQIEEARKEKAQNEVASLAVAEGECVELLKSLRFRDALRSMDVAGDELETDEAKVALLTAKDRINRLKSFHEYLVKNTPGFKSARGWSITSADKKYLVVGNNKVSWVEIYSTKIEIVAEFVNMLVLDNEVKKSMRIREHTRLMTNAALFLSVFYADMPAAQSKAKKLAEDAVQQFDVDSYIIKGLLPQFFEEEL
ncbi:MAG: protein kinase [Kiritimatiellae bacterium]|jgi:serine/threonine protein kinase|nr:protein kinase [Kiritimatiellia bacterium]